MPITASIWPGSIACAAGEVTWASTLPTATAIPSGSPVHPPPRRSARRRARRARPAGARSCRPRSRRSARRAPPGTRARGSGRPGRWPCSRPCRRCASRGRTAARRSSRRPRSSGPRARRRLGVLLEHLQRLGELPLGGDPAAVARQPRLAALLGERVDAVGLPLRGVVLPQLHVRVRAPLEAVDAAQRRAVAQHRHRRRRGEVDARCRSRPPRRRPRPRPPPAPPSRRTSR